MGSYDPRIEGYAISDETSLLFFWVSIDGLEVLPIIVTRNSLVFLGSICKRDRLTKVARLAFIRCYLGE